MWWPFRFERYESTTFGRINIAEAKHFDETISLDEIDEELQSEETLLSEANVSGHNVYWKLRFLPGL